MTGKGIYVLLALIAVTNIVMAASVIMANANLGKAATKAAAGGT